MTCHQTLEQSYPDRNRDLFFLSVILIFLSLCPNLCRAEDGDENEDFLHAKDRIEWQAGGFYEGTFADGTPFQMNLPYAAPEAVARHLKWADGSTMEVMQGMYWYPRKFAGNTLALNVETSSDSGFTAEVYLTTVAKDDTEKRTLEERLTGQFSPDKTLVTGKWTHERKNREMSFSMKRVFAYKGVFVSRQLTGENYEGKNEQYTFVFNAIFPIIGDAAVDAKTASRTVASYCSFDEICLNRTEAVWLSPTLLSLHDLSFGYGHGAAHGQTHTDHRHYVVENAGYRQVGLDHFITTSPQCLETIARRLIASLKGQGMSMDGTESITAKDVANRTNFLPTPSGIRFDFDQYEVGPYAEGAPKTFLTRQNLGNCVKYLPTY